MTWPLSQSSLPLVDSSPISFLVAHVFSLLALLNFIYNFDELVFILTMLFTYALRFPAVILRGCYILSPLEVTPSSVLHILPRPCVLFLCSVFHLCFNLLQFFVIPVIILAFITCTFMQQNLVFQNLFSKHVISSKFNSKHKRQVLYATQHFHFT